jgi:c-di-GMP-binding flagellar brake protein YcgR
VSNSPKKIPASQRREFHRLEILMPVSYKLMSEQALRGHSSRPELGSTINLSLGGMLIGTAHEIQPKSRLFCTFKLFAGEPEIWVEGLALDTQAQPEGAVFKYLSHLRFDHPGRETEQALGRFIMQKQKESRRH